MPPSSWRNAVKRITHKERSQPSRRKGLGLLEKHKDYVKRARDFHRKEREIKRLRERASLRNPDEFFHAMINASTRGGVHQLARKTSTSRTPREVSTLTRQDLAYLMNARQSESKRIERLREKLRQSSWSVTDLHSGAGGKTSGGNNRVHRVFVDSPTQVERFSAEEYFDTPRELIPMIGHRLRRQNLIDLAQQSRGEEDVSSLLSSKSNRTSKTKTAMEAKELTEREKRCSRIDVNIQRLELQQHLMKKGRHRKIAPASSTKAATFKWARERKR